MPFVLGLKKHLASVKIKHSHDLAQALSESLCSRFKGIVDFLISDENALDEIEVFGEKTYMLATVLDPNVKFFWLGNLNNKSDKEKEVIKNKCISMIIKELKKFDKSNENKDLASSSSQPQINTSSNIFSYRDQILKSTLVDNKLESIYKSELEEYLNFFPNDLLQKEMDPCEFWRKYHFKFSYLYELFKKVYSSCATNVESEQVFSKLSIRMASNYSECENSVSGLVFIDCNWNYLQI